MMKKIMVLLCVMVFSAVGVFAKTPQNNLEEALADAVGQAEQHQQNHGPSRRKKYLRNMAH